MSRVEERVAVLRHVSCESNLELTFSSGWKISTNSIQACNIKLSYYAWVMVWRRGVYGSLPMFSLTLTNRNLHSVYLMDWKKVFLEKFA